MKVEITIDTNNSAFSPSPAAGQKETARILHELADKLIGFANQDCDIRSIPLLDINGNTVGKYTLKTSRARQ